MTRAFEYYRVLGTNKQRNKYGGLNVLKKLFYSNYCKKLAENGKLSPPQRICFIEVLLFLSFIFNLDVTFGRIMPLYVLMYIILLFRVRDLLKSGVVKEKPVWYDVMAAFPPFVEPDLSREAEPGRVKKIVYSEDTIRRLVFISPCHQARI